jgi:methionyl-tRNA synthetase
VDPEVEQEFALGLEADAMKTVAEFEGAMESFAFQKALIFIWEFINQMNKYVDVTAPWELAKKKSNSKQLEAVIYNLLEGLRIISGLIYPVMPETAETMQKHLGLNQDKLFFKLGTLKCWKTIQPGKKLPKAITLFPRIDPEKPGKSKPVNRSISKLTPDTKPEITINDFSKIDLRVATVVKAEMIPRAKKLLKLEVDLGEKRTIIAGIAENYEPEELMGKQIIIVANLKPAKIMGILSNGMLIAASEKNKTVVATLDKKVKPGTPLS